MRSLRSMCAIMRSICDMCVPRVFRVCSVCTGMFQKVSLQSGVSCVTVLVIGDAVNRCLREPQNGFITERQGIP